MTLLLITVFICILALGLSTIIKRLLKYQTMLAFALSYRDYFVMLVNSWWQNYDRFERRGQIHQEAYVWLTKNVDQMQSDLGYHGKMTYVGPFQSYKITNYQILINTLPKFRNGQVEEFDINATDDALLRHIGVVEDLLVVVRKKLRNPIIWFREGFKTVLGLPVYILNWFGIISDYTTRKVITNQIFKLLAGIGALVTFISGLITIIQGKEQALLLMNTIAKFLHIKE